MSREIITKGSIKVQLPTRLENKNRNGQSITVRVGSILNVRAGIIRVKVEKSLMLGGIIVQCDKPLISHS